MFKAVIGTDTRKLSKRMRIVMSKWSSSVFQFVDIRLKAEFLQVRLFVASISLHKYLILNHAHLLIKSEITIS